MLPVRRNADEIVFPPPDFGLLLSAGREPTEERRLSIPIPFHVCRSTFRKWELEIDMRPRPWRREGRKDDYDGSRNKVDGMSHLTQVNLSQRFFRVRFSDPFTTP